MPRNLTLHPTATETAHGSLIQSGVHASPAHKYANRHESAPMTRKILTRTSPTTRSARQRRRAKFPRRQRRLQAADRSESLDSTRAGGARKEIPGARLIPTFQQPRPFQSRPTNCRDKGKDVRPPGHARLLRPLCNSRLSLRATLVPSRNTRSPDCESRSGR